jgi:hypothetical protein
VEHIRNGQDVHESQLLRRFLLASHALGPGDFFPSLLHNPKDSLHHRSLPKSPICPPLGLRPKLLLSRDWDGFWSMLKGCHNFADRCANNVIFKSFN